MVEAVARSRALHRPWVRPPETLDAYERWLVQVSQPTHRSHLVLADRGSGQTLVGVINANEIVMGAFCSAYLGYYAFSPHARCGLMRAGMSQVLARLFGEQGLHRVEANIQPDNTASLAFVRSLGFRREGFSPRYLQIEGEWRDHERWALLEEEWVAGAFG